MASKLHTETHVPARCASCHGELKVNSQGYPVPHQNRGDGACTELAARDHKVEQALHEAWAAQR